MKRSITKIFSFILVLSLLMSVATIVSSAAVTEDNLKLVDEAQGVAEAFGGGSLHLGWGNNSGMRFDVLDGEVFTGATFRTISPGKFTIKASLFKWNTKLEDKVLLEEKELESADWQYIVFDFDKAYPAGTYYFMVETFAENGVEPRLYCYKKVIAGRNIAAFQYDRTFKALGEANSNRDFGEGFDMTIKLLKGTPAEAQTFLKKYHEVKAKVEGGATIHDKAKYDAVMNAVESNMKSFMTSATAETLTNYTNDLTAAMTASSENPATGDEGIISLVMLVLVVSCAYVIVSKRSKATI